MLKCVSSILLLVALYSNAAAGVIYVEDCVIKSNPSTDSVEFFVEFTETPDLWRSPGQGESFNAFQIDLGDTQVLSDNWITLLTPYGEDIAGIRTNLSGPQLRFELPLSLVSPNNPSFDYVISSYNGGTLSSFMNGQAVAVPEPHPIALTILGILFVVVVCYGRDDT